MTNLIFDIPTPSVAISGANTRFPVRRIFCVGRNYEAHAKECGNNPKDPPFFFTKPADAVVESGAKLPFPVATENLHFEAELVVAIGIDGSAIARAAALAHVFGFAAGNDLGENGGLNLELGGEPIVRGPVIFTIDGTSFTMTAWATEGRINTECSVCAQTYTALWEATAAGNMMSVTASDGRTASFSLRGSRDALGDVACRPDDGF